MVMLDLADARRAEEQRQADAAATKVAAAVNPALFALGGDVEDAKFRRITSKSTMRDLNPLMQERMQQVCFFLAVTTPFGKRIVEIITSYTVGEGFKASCEDESATAVIDDFWGDEVNNMEERIGAWSNELCIFGELCIPVFVNSVDGSVRLGNIDPMDIDAIEYGTLTASDGRQELAIPVAVRLKQKVGESQQRKLQIIRRDEDPNSETFGQLIGDCFYFKINAAQASSRGISELFSLADWIDVFDQMVFDFADKIRFLNQYIWEWTVAGADDKKVEEIQRKVTKSPPKQGQTLVHSDSVKVGAVTPDFKGADMSEGARMVKLYGLGGAGLPAWFFADPVDSNRSTAQEMEGPTGKKLTDWQNKLKRIMRRVLAFVLDQAINKGVLPEGSYPVQLTVPDLSIKDITRAATIMQTTAMALAMAEDRGWIRGETAAKSLHVMLQQVGVDVDSDDEYQLAQTELETKQSKEINNANPQQNLADAMKQSTTPAAGGAVQ
ncbi:MAG: hypothetical protein JWN45_2935 [Acidobacteriaceae bacterium]|nr:hypothetical protein [Acidobacteriaceae bacterium]